MRASFIISALSTVMVMHAQQPDTTLLRIAEDHVSKSECKDAERVLAPLLELDPPLAKAVLLRSKCHILKGERMEESLHALQEVLDRGPNTEILVFRGDLYNELRMFDRADTDLTLAVETATDSILLISALNRRAWNNLQTLRLDNARKDLDRILATDSMDKNAINTMALMASQQGDTATAFRMLKTLIQLDEGSPIGWVNMGYFLGTCGRHAEALTYYAQAEALGIKSAYFLNNRGFSKLGSGDIKGARKDVERSIRMDGSNPYAYRNLAHIELAAKNEKAMCAAIEKALALGFTRMYGNEMADLRRTHCN